MRRLGLGVGLAALLASVAARAEKKKPGLFDFETWKTPQGHQRDAIQQLAPHQLDLTPAEGIPGGEPRKMKLRVYADKDYRAMTLHWKKTIATQLARVNRVLEAVFNVQLEVEALREWPASHNGARLEAILDELRQMDPGNEADWTIALVTPFKGVATSIHQLGQAPILGHHFVMRGMDDEQEGLALDREFGLLSPEERGRMYGDRKVHKETVVFLHEWGHSLGALHAEDEPAIMHPHYDAKRRAFSDYQKRLLSFVLGRRLAAPGEPYPEREGLAAILADAPPQEGTAEERGWLTDFAKGRQAPAPRMTGDGKSPSPGEASARALKIPRADVETFNKAVEALNAEHFDEAWSLLGPLTKKHPKETAVQTLACNLVAGHAAAADAKAACDAGEALAPKDPDPPLRATRAYGRAADLAGAVAQLNVALSRIDEKDSKTWSSAASLATSLGAFALADAAFGHLARGPESQALIEEAEQQRARMALPHTRDNWGLTPEDEARYVAQYRTTAEALGTTTGAPARERVAAFKRAFPAPPGAELLECELELSAKHLGPAGKACEAALKKSDQVPRAHYLLGFIAARQRQDSVAEKHLRRAILLDPRAEGPWKSLALMYRSTRSAARLAELKSQHQSLLKTPLPE